MTQGTGNGSGSTAADLGHDPLVTGTPYGTTGGESRPQQTAGAAKEQASAVAGTAKHQASAVAGTAKEQASAVAGTAKEQASVVAGTAKDQAGNVLAEAKDQAADLFADLRQQLSEQSDAVRDRIAAVLTTAGSELADMAGAGGSGYATQVVRQVGDRASSWGSHLTNHDSADLLEQTRSFARRKPGTFLLGALVTGLVAGRLTRGAKAHHDETTAVATSTNLTPRPVTTSSVTTSSVMTPAAVPPVVAPANPFVSPDIDDVTTRTRPTTPYGRDDAAFIDPPEYRP